MYAVDFHVVGSDTKGPLRDLTMTISEAGTDSACEGVTISYNNEYEIYEVDIPEVGDYEVILQKEGYLDSIQNFSISDDDVSAEESGNIYVLDATVYSLAIEMEPAIVLRDVKIYYFNTALADEPYPCDTDRLDIKAALQVLYGSNLRWYSDHIIDFVDATMLPHWITGSRGPLNPDPSHPIDGFSLDDNPTLNSLNQRIHSWPTDWATPTFSWYELLHRASDPTGGHHRDFIYERNVFNRLDVWGGELRLTPGTRRFWVEVSLQDTTISSADEECSTRVSIRDSRSPEGCNARVTQYLRWLTAFLEIPYEWGGHWFGGLTGNGVGGGDPYEGYAIDCSGLVCCGVKFAGYRWAAGWLHGNWRYSTHALNNISDRINNQHIAPGDILNRPGAHVVTVHRVIDTSNPNNIRINIIEASGGADKVRILTNRSLQANYLNHGYTLRRIGLSILSIDNPIIDTGFIIVTVRGTRFDAAVSIRFGEDTAILDTYVNSRTIRVHLPPREAGTVDVNAENPDGETFAFQNGFTYRLTILGLFPNSGTIAGGITITLRGIAFTPETAIRFGTELAAFVAFVDNLTIQVTLPSKDSTGTVDVTATKPDSSTHTLVNGFTYT